MEDLIITNETIDLYKGFLTEPGKYGCTYAPIDEVFEEFDGCTPKHILFDEYVKKNKTKLNYKNEILR